MPPATVARAKAVLDKLEAGRAKTGGLAAGLDDLPLFAAAVEAEEAHSDALRDDLIALNIDAMTPRDALDALRTEESRGGKERVRTQRSRRWPYPSKKKKTHHQ